MATATTKAPTAGSQSEGDSAPAAHVIGRMATVGAHVVRESVARPKARAYGDVPCTPQAVTKQFLESVLVRGLPGVRVEDFTANHVSSGTSTRWNVRVTYNDEGRGRGLPEALFAKTSLGFRQRLVLGLAGVIQSEPTFYENLRPGLGVEVPQGYYGAVCTRSWRSIAMIEDIAATKGAAFNTPRSLISREQMEDLLANMATWHGAYWDSPKLTEHGLRTPREFMRAIDRFIGWEKRSRIGMQRAGAVMPAALEGRHDDLYRALLASMEIASAGELTLLHGDSHVGNTYVTAAGRMGFTDWQVIQRGRWAYDVAYAINSGLAVEDRRAWDRELLGFYLERLAAAGGRAPDFDDAWRLYRQCSIYPYFAWAYTIGRSALQPKMQPDEVSLAIIERTANAIVDLESIAAVG